MEYKPVHGAISVPCSEAQLYSHTVLPKFTDKLLLGKAKQAHIELSHTRINITILLITTMSMCHVFIPHSSNFSYHIILMYNAHYKRLDTGGYGICLLRVLPLLFSLACDRAIHTVVQFLVLVTHDCIYIPWRHQSQSPGLGGVDESTSTATPATPLCVHSSSPPHSSPVHTHNNVELSLYSNTHRQLLTTSLLWSLDSQELSLD